MTRVKRLWADEDIIGTAQTLVCLRRLRTAAVAQPGLWLHANAGLSHLFGGEGSVFASQEALLTAEQLGAAASDFFAAKLSKTASTEHERWQDLLSDAQRRCSIYGTTTYAQTSMREVVENSVIGRLRNLSIDPQYMLRWDLLENNNLGVSSLDALPAVGVVAPLSGDYLMASTYSSYLGRTKGTSFAVRAAALSRDLSRIALPLDELDKPVLADKASLAIYLDTVETGNTGEALWAAMREAYPDYPVHKPKGEVTEFTPSERINWYWARR